MSFTITAVILGACSPLIYFMVWNFPPLDTTNTATNATYGLLLESLVAIIALAGIIGNVRLLQLLRQLSGNGISARRTLVAWLAGNLLLGSQLAWILRPFVGSPGLPVEFLRSNPFDSNFFEALWMHLQHLIR
jgi:hypothetical protein